MKTYCSRYKRNTSYRNNPKKCQELTNPINDIIEKCKKNNNYLLNEKDLKQTYLIFDEHLPNCNIFSKYSKSNEFQRIITENFKNIFKNIESYSYLIDMIIGKYSILRKFKKSFKNSMYKQIIEYIKENVNIYPNKILYISLIFGSKSLNNKINELLMDNNLDFLQILNSRFRMQTSFSNIDFTLFYNLLNARNINVFDNRVVYSSNIFLILKKKIEKYEKDNYNTFNAWINSLTHSNQILLNIMDNREIVTKQRLIKFIIKSNKKFIRIKNDRDPGYKKYKENRNQCIDILLKNFNNIDKDIIMHIFTNDFEFNKIYFKNIIHKKNFYDILFDIVCELYSINMTDIVNKIIDEFSIYDKKYYYCYDIFKKVKCLSEHKDEFKKYVKVDILVKNIENIMISRNKDINKLDKSIKLISDVGYEIDEKSYENILRGYINYKSNNKNPEIIINLSKCVVKNIN